MFRLLFARSYLQVNKPIKIENNIKWMIMQINEIVIHFIVFSSFRRLANLEKSDCRWHFLLQAKFHSKRHRHMFTLKRQSCCLPYFSIYVPKLDCFYNDVLMDGISLKCSIQYYNFTLIGWPFNDDEMADHLINMCNFLVILIPITQTDMLTRNMVLSVHLLKYLYESEFGSTCVIMRSSAYPKV